MKKTLHAFLKKTRLSKATDIFYNPLYKLVMTPIKRRQMLKLYSQFIRKGELCFDIGANVGNRVEVFAKLGARVIAVEPQPGCVEKLQRKFGENDNITIIPCAIDKETGTAELYVNPHNELWTMSSMSKGWIESRQKGNSAEWTKKISVKTTTLDELIAKYGKPAFVKIDVEGYEYNCLLGLSGPVQTISFEYTPCNIKSTIQCLLFLNELMPNALYNYSELETFKFILPKWVDANRILEIFKTMPNDSVEGDIYVKA